MKKPDPATHAAKAAHATTAPLGTQTLARGLTALEAVAAGASDLRAIAQALGTTRSTTHRLVSFLLQAGWLRQLDGSGLCLGPRLIEMGTVALDQIPLSVLARPHLRHLADLTGDTIHLGVQDEDDVLYLEKIPGTKGLEMRSRPGYRMPMASTGIGKSLMLDMSEDLWKHHFERSVRIAQSATIVPEGLLEWPEYLTRMRTYAQSGHAVDLEENESGIRCVSAPIRDARKNIAGAISVATTVPYMPLERIETLIPLVRQCANDISREIGWKGPDA